MNTLTHAAGVVAPECVTGNIDLFSLPQEESAIEKTYFVEYSPTNPLVDSTNNISIIIPPSDDFLDLADSYVYIQTKITKANGDDLDAFVAGTPAAGGNAAVPPNSVGFIQIPLTSMFSSIGIRLNEESLSDTFHTQPFISYIQTILNYGSDARLSRLSTQGFFNDVNPNVVVAHAAANYSGFKERAGLTALSRTATFAGPIFNGIFSQTRYMVSLMPIHLDFVRAPASFCLKSNHPTEQFKYKITSLKFFLKKVKLRSSIKLDLEQKLLKQPALYPIRHSYCKPIFLERRTRQASFENIFNSKTIPEFACVALVLQTDFRGAYGTSPYQFGNFDCTDLKISIDSEVYPSPSGYHMNYTSTTEPCWVKPYMNLFDGGSLKADQGLPITYDMFGNNGFAMYTFTFGRESNFSGDHTVVKSAGSARLDISFSPTSTNEALILLLYCESDEMISVDANRQVNRDFHL